jgi:hypothetical protein
VSQVALYDWAAVAYDDWYPTLVTSVGGRHKITVSFPTEVNKNTYQWGKLDTDVTD